MSLMDTATYLDEGRRWRFDWLLPALFQPRRAFPWIVSAGPGVWLTPVVTLLVTGLVRALLAGSIKASNAASGQTSLPQGFEWYTPEQQAQFFQAMSATNNWVFHYLLPGVLALLGVLGLWLVTGFLLHLVLTLLGGRSSSGQVLNVVAWASLPFAVRDGVRIAAMLNSSQLLTSPGLAGFAPAGEGGGALYLAALLALVDIYLLWHVLLLGRGLRAAAGLSRGKTWGAVLVTVLVLLLLRGLPALVGAQFSDLTIIRPFF
jgi:hypothetical protein